MIRKLTSVMFSVATMVALLSLATVVFATTLNVDFNNPAGSPWHGTYVGVGGYAGDTGTFWNGFSVTGNGANSGNLKASDGVTVTPVNITLNTGVASDATGSAYATGLLSDYTGDAGTFTISGLLAGQQYQLYFYSQNGPWGGTTTSFSVGAATTTCVGGGDIPLTIGNNYNVLSGLTADVDGKLSGSVAMVTGGAIFNGIQIVGQVPEPGTLALLATALFGLLAYAWRKRR